MSIPQSRLTIFSMAILLTLFSGCGTTRPSRFYTLNPLQTLESAKQVALPGPPISIGIAPVEIPDYLDRPQIVRRTDKSELFIDEFDRWAGSLDDDIARVLSENLSILLSQEHVLILTGGGAAPVEHRIVVKVSRFDLMPDDTALLKSQWTVFGKDGRIILIRESNFSEHIDGVDYGARIAAMSRAIEMLSRDIAEAMKPLIKAEKN